MDEYPNAAEAAAWNAQSRGVGWADVGGPVPAGWRYEPGWGLTRIVEALAAARAAEVDEGELAAVDPAPDDPWS